MNETKGYGPIIINDYHGKSIRALTPNQELLCRQMEKYDILFVNGPAGVGKTFLATAMAIKGIKERKYSKLVLTRPIVDCDEELGFLPGDMFEKVEPYMRPLKESIEKIIGKFDLSGTSSQLGKVAEKPASKYSEKVAKRNPPKKNDGHPNNEFEFKQHLVNNIEVAPLAFMRGATHDKSFVILDEAQNVTVGQMKMLLTRLGKDSKVIICGDKWQNDLKGIESGFTHAQDLLRDVDGIGVFDLNENDIVRHKLVKDIILKYDRKDFVPKYSEESFDEKGNYIFPHQQVIRHKGNYGDD